MFSRLIRTPKPRVKNVMNMNAHRRLIMCSSISNNRLVSKQFSNNPTTKNISMVTIQHRAVNPGTPMYCMQCEQTSHNIGCTSQGICGKTAPVANVQELLLYVNNGVTQYMARLGEDKLDRDLRERIRRNTLYSYFSTLTNVNFSENAIYQYIQNTIAIRQELVLIFRSYYPQLQDFEYENSPATYELLEQNETAEDAQRAASLHTIKSLMGDENSFGLRECAQYGLKGLCAYLAHAENIRRDDEAIYSDQERAVVFGELYDCMTGLCELDQSMEYYWQLCLKVGATNLKVMELLDRAHNTYFGHQVVRQVSCTPVPGKCILLSGHDIVDVRNILADIDEAGYDIGVYTHGELLPAHAYPEVNKFLQLKGHFGDAWQLQIHNFKDFPGPIVMTSNCLMPPRRKYRDRLYTSHAVGYDDIKHVDMQSKEARARLLQHALEMPGFTQEQIDAKKWADYKPMTVGFNHHTLKQHSETLLAAIKNGDLKHIFYIGGCDGTEHVRSYFGEIGALSPAESVILTSGCGKFRLRHLELGTLGDTGLPRILDMGQCNDAFSVVVIGKHLCEALGCELADLPLHLVVSWLEQKAVVVLLSMLHLGLRNIRLGPALPAFFTPDVRQFLFEKLRVQQINAKNESADMEAYLKEVTQHPVEAETK